MSSSQTRAVWGLMGFRRDPVSKGTFAAVGPVRSGGFMDGAEAIEIPCPKQICAGSEAKAEAWAKVQVEQRGFAFYSHLKPGIAR